MTDRAIAFSALGHAYQPEQWVFQNLSGEVHRGEVFALLGPNGCGKTTLLKALLGAIKPTEGQVHVSGSIGFVPQIFQVSFDFTSLDMVLMGRASRIGLFSTPSREDREAALQAMDRFGIVELAARPFHELSGGQRQLVIFARALVSEAEILILDEPTSALDLKNQAMILDWLHKLSHEDGLTVLFTTHHPHHALAVADTTLLMLGQSHFECGPAAQVLNEENLRSLYGIDIRRLSFEHRGKNTTTLVPIFLSHANSLLAEERTKA